VSAAEQIRGLARELSDASEAALMAVGMEAKTIAVDEGKRATRGRGRISGMGGKPLTAGFDIAPPLLIIKPRPVGPWTFVDQGTKRGGWIIPRKTSIVKRRGKWKVVNGVRLRSGEVRPFVWHPPIAGKKAWEKVRVRIVDAAPDLAFEHAQKAVRSI